MMTGTVAITPIPIPFVITGLVLPAPLPRPLGIGTLSGATGVVGTVVR